jgi:hypothetical protein
MLNVFFLVSTVLLAWLGIHEGAAQRATGGTASSTISLMDLPHASHEITKAVLDKAVDSQLVMHLFEARAWDRIIQLIQDKTANHVWRCDCCNGCLEDSRSILCDLCFSWYHLKCCGLIRPPKTKSWICNACFQAAAF